MIKKLQAIHADAANKHFAVYCPRPGLYVAVAFHENTSDATIHATIADFEQNRSRRDYMGVVKPGSFNVICLFAPDIDRAVAYAKLADLEHEPMKTVLSRHVTAQAEAAKKPAEPEKPKAATPPQEEPSLGDILFGRKNPIGGFFDDLFSGGRPNGPS